MTYLLGGPGDGIKAPSDELKTYLLPNQEIYERQSVYLHFRIKGARRIKYTYEDGTEESYWRAVFYCQPIRLRQIEQALEDYKKSVKGLRTLSAEEISAIRSDPSPEYRQILKEKLTIRRLVKHRLIRLLRPDPRVDSQESVELEVVDLDQLAQLDQ